jgi:hypothetical protein
MKKTLLAMTAILLLSVGAGAQDAYTQSMQAAVTRLDKATSVKDYQQLAGDFQTIADQQKKDWLPYYYAAFCNAKTGWLLQDDGDKIEQFADQGDEEIRKAQSLLDTATQKKQLSEIYCVLSMTNQARVFINPQTYGAKYGPTASRYRQLAEKANPDNPRALYMLGWEKFTTPKLWGGDKTKAKEYLENAKQKLAVAPSTGLDPHWGKKEIEDLLK